MTTTLSLRGAASMARDTCTVFRLFEGLTHGRLEVRLPDGSAHVFGGGDPGLTLQVHDEAVFSRVLARGDIGLAEAYLDGLWDTSDLTALLMLFARNREALRRAVYGSWRALIAARFRHLLRRNSRSGSRRNIMAHYDLGNAFYAQWLDPTMSYSSALYADAAGAAAETPSLASAQSAKYRRILDRLQAQPGESVLEIGCGWGGFAEEAAARQLNVTGVTLSPAQLEWAQRRVPQADLRLQDYRDLTGQHDHVVSIEMFEAVGERWWPSYFGQVARSLRPGGRAVIQSITIDESLFDTYRRGTDFIQQYVFPGGMLPSRTAFREQARRQGLQVRDEFAFGLDYARTLAEWRHAFEARWPQIQPLGFDETFRRLWRLYLCYCEAGFRTGNIDVVQFELAHE
jgi:cyclopropane-fatty-acyl-phospholipid synthase